MTLPLDSNFTEVDFDFCKKSLSVVSRTFALNIKVLSGDLHKTVLLCYLLCRIIDTIEDCPDQSSAWKQKLLSEFPQFLDSPEGDQLELWITEALKGEAKPFERELLQESTRVMRGYWSLPQGYRECIREWVTKMSGGMIKYIQHFDEHEDIIINDQNELEDYCYFVAGTVGLFLTTCFSEHYKFSDEKFLELKKNAVSFGVGLQLTNIAKDLIEDRQRGWTYLPLSFLHQQGLTLEQFMEMKSEHHEQIEKAYFELLEAALEHLKNALEYTLALPINCVQARIFCLWPLWMAMETLITLKDQKSLLLEGKKVKITRQQVKEILGKTTLMSPFDFLLRRDFEKKLEHFEALSPIQ